MKLSMSYLLIFFGILVLAMVSISCKSKKKAMAAAEVVEKNLSEEEVRQLPILMKYSKSPCYGQCPTFKMTVHQGGWTIFEGKRFTAKEGTTVIHLEAAALEQLLLQCKEADIWSAETAYGMRMQDLPTTTLRIYEEGKDKMVQWRMRHPERLKKLDSQLMDLVIAQGWIKPRISNKARNTSTAPDVIIDNELIVQLRDKLQGVDWVTKYKKYGMQLKKPISKLANMYLFLFDTDIIDANEMLEIVQSDEQVSRAEFNKKMQSRTR